MGFFCIVTLSMPAMIIKSNSISQAEFVRKVLERDTKNIFKAQELIIAQRLYLSGKDLKAKKRQKGINKRSGKLEQSVTTPEYFIHSQGEQFSVAAMYPIYIRFLDMKRLGNWRLFNRPVWGILYNNALRDIAFKYGDEIRDFVGEALQNASPSKS